MTKPPTDPAGRPPYLVRLLLWPGVLRDPAGSVLGSGVLLAADRVLTARRVLGERRVPADLLVASGAVRYPVADLIAPAADPGLALLRLAGPAVGVPPAALVAGLVAADLRRAGGRLIAAGGPGESAVVDPPGRVDWPGCADLPPGLGGGALCLDRPPDWPLVGLIDCGGEGAATPRVIPAGAILEFLHRAAPDLAGRVRTLPAATPAPVAGAVAGDPAAWDRQRHLLRDLLVSLPPWKLVRDRMEFVETALVDHPAAAGMIWDDDPYTVAGNLVQRLKRFREVPLDDGRQAVCGLLAEVQRRPRCQDPAITEPLRRLIEAFGCSHP